MRFLRHKAPGGLFSLILACLVSGCSYLGSARTFDPRDLERDSGWIALKSVPLISQQEEEDCGVAALSMVLRHWNRPADRDRILEACPIKSGEGIKAKDLRDFAKREGLEAFLIHGDWQDFEKELARGHPLIVGLIKPYASGNISHYEVVVGVHPETRNVLTLDPANGWRKNTCEGFFREWEPAGRLTLVVFEGFPRRPSRSGQP